MSSLPDDAESEVYRIAESEVFGTLEQHEDDIVASSLGFTDISSQTPTTTHASLSILTPTCVPLHERPHQLSFLCRPRHPKASLYKRRQLSV